jgi:hypothetical protein
MKTPEEQTAAPTRSADQAINGIHQPPGLPSNGEPPMSKQEFEAKNKRRLELIEKDLHRGGLSKEEEDELTHLEEVTDYYIDTIFPLPFAQLEEIKEAFRRDGINVDQMDK